MVNLVLWSEIAWCKGREWTRFEQSDRRDTLWMEDRLIRKKKIEDKAIFGEMGAWGLASWRKLRCFRRRRSS